MFLSSQNEEFVNILEELQNRTEVLRDSISQFTRRDRLKGHFCTDAIFKFGHKVQKTKVETNVLDFALIQRKINKPELRKNFEEFRLSMIIRWHLWNEPNPNTSNIPAFSPKSVHGNELTVILIWNFLKSG